MIVGYGSIQEYLAGLSRKSQDHIEPQHTNNSWADGALKEKLQPQTAREDPHVVIATGITSITEEQRAQIKALIVNGHSVNYSSIGQELQDEFWDLNMDCRRIAVTEQAVKGNNACLARIQPGEQVQWLGHPGAFQYCQALKGRVFRVVSSFQKEKNPEEEVRWANPWKTMANVSIRVFVCQVGDCENADPQSENHQAHLSMAYVDFRISERWPECQDGQGKYSWLTPGPCGRTGSDFPRRADFSRFP